MVPTSPRRSSDASGAAQAPGHVIYPTEAEGFVRELAPFKIADIGSDRYALYQVCRNRGLREGAQLSWWIA